MIVLESGPARVEIDPEVGARIASLQIGGLELLLTRHANPMSWGSYPMAPYAGRVRDGRFEFEGQRYQLPISMPPHAIHGTVYTRPWAQLGEGQFSIELGPDWPFAGRVLQSFELDERGMTMKLEVHTDGPAFPAHVGWHPWFRRQLSDGAAGRLIFGAQHMHMHDAHGIPSGDLCTPTPGPWDHCFSGLTCAPGIDWDNGLRLRLHSSAKHWVVYDEPADSICIEPQSAPPDALNSGAALVSKDEPLTLDLRMTWE